MSVEDGAKAGLGKCTICGRPATEQFKPFCSSRCSMIDLGHWLGEGYRVPVKQDDPEEDFFTPPKNQEE
jgi:endogenous inhibitor of DNA gyrase (YacG/DUF329 family)